MNIRKADLNDLAQIVVLSDKMMDFHCSLDSYYGIYREYDDSSEYYKNELVKNDRLYLVAENKEGELVGFASTYFTSMPDTPAPAIGTLVTNFVLEEFRGQGIGTAFHEKRIEWLKTNNVKHIEMSVDVNNKNALDMWKKKGFKDYQYTLRKDL
jgi:diamine N-acetyltransferase